MSKNTDSQNAAGLGFLVVVAVIVLFFVANFHVPNSGQHTGYVTSVEQSGIIWKTWTVYVKTDPQSSQEDTYCVTDPSVVSALQSEATGKDSVTIYYSVPMLTWKWQCGGEQSIIQSVNTPPVTTASTDQPVDDSLASSFMCPESYQTAQEQTDAVAKFISDYTKLHPNATVADMQIYRYQLLVSHSCDQTLKNMLQDVAPIDSMLNFLGKDFGPQTTQFNSDTDVWSSYFTLNGQDATSPDEELIFNFYLKNVWANKAITALDIANVYLQNSNVTIINKFTAPDTLTKLPAYFIFSDAIYADQGYAYVYVTKISTIQDNAFSVIYSKKITDNAANLQNDIDTWLAQDLKSTDGASSEISNTNVDSSWISYLSNKAQN